MSDGPAPPYSPPTPPEPSAAPPPAGRGAPSRRLPTLIAVVGVAVVVLVAGLLILRMGSTSGASAGETFRAAEAAANGTSRSYDNGAYAQLMLAQAVHGVASLNFPITGSGVAGACTLRLLSGGSVGVSPTSGSAGSGSSSFWEFLYAANLSHLLAVVVTDGQASAAFTLNGTSCAQVYPGWQPVPAGAIDSSAAAADANAAGGSGFLARFPQAAGVYVLSNALAPASGAVWSIGYTTCPETPTPSGNGTFFTAAVNANTGGVRLTATQSLTCQAFYPFGTAPLLPPTPLGTALVFGAPSQTSNSSAGGFCAITGGSSDWCDVLPIQSVGDGMTASNLQFELQDSSGHPIHFSAGSPTLRIESVAGSSLATYSFATASWTSGGSLGLSTTETMVVDLGCTVSGASTCSPVPTGSLLVALGVDGFTGQVEVTLV